MNVYILKERVYVFVLMLRVKKISNLVLKRRKISLYHDIQSHDMFQRVKFVCRLFVEKETEGPPWIFKKFDFLTRIDLSNR